MNHNTFKKYSEIYPKWTVNETPPMFSIKEGSFIEPITHLRDYYANSSSSYYSDLYKSLKSKAVSKNISDLPIKTFTPEIDQMLIEYIKCRENIRIITIYPRVQYHKYQDNINKYLSKIGSLIAIKDIVLTKRGASSLLYQLYGPSDKLKHINEITEKLKAIQSDEETNIYNVIVYDGPKIDERELSNKCLGGNRRNSNMDDIFHISESHGHSVEIAQIYFNINTLNMLPNICLDRFISNNDRDLTSFVFFNYYKKLQEQFTRLDQIRGIIYGSYVLYSYGLRLSNDIDAVYLYLPDNKQTANFQSTFRKLFESDNKTKNKTNNKTMNTNSNSKKFIDCMEIALKGSTNWKPFWEDHLNKLAQFAGIGSYDDIILNPKYHFYFMGIKMMTLDIDTIRRLYRRRPAAYADIIATNILLDRAIYLPCIPKHITYYNNDINHNKFNDKVKCYLRKRYNIKSDYNRYITNIDVSNDIGNTDYKMTQFKELLRINKLNKI